MLHERICQYTHCSKVFLITQARLNEGRGTFCCYTCSQKAHTFPLVTRFWSHVEKTDTCWLWRGKRSGWYGTIGSASPDFKKLYAHRVAWEIGHGPIPEGLHVLHHCDTPPCVNYERCLFLGTNAENMADRDAKGRCWHPHREAHFKAKLTELQVLEIYRLAGSMTTSALARKYGVSHMSIKYILIGKNWKHVYHLYESISHGNSHSI
jgi:hypothetical protein